MSKKYFPLWARFVLFNVASVIFLLFKGQFRSDSASIVGIVFAFALMNFVAWLSSRSFQDWK